MPCLVDRGAPIGHHRADSGQPPIEPLYTQKQVDQLRPLFKQMQMRYDHPTNVTADIRVRAVEAGHILGSASLEVTVDDNGCRKVVVFSGDLGPRGAPLHRDPVPFVSRAEWSLCARRLTSSAD